MTRQKLPIGIQTFREIREEGCYYVDKTAFALRLIEQGKYYFLSRPRRFGKWLFLDTLGELLAGNEALFRGLYIHDRWDWTQRHPVIRLSFGGGVVQSRAELDHRILALLRKSRRDLRLEAVDITDVVGGFSDLIEDAEATAGRRVVILVDEYDKPILDNLSRPDVARELRDGLRNLYSVIKDQDAHLRFASANSASGGSRPAPRPSSSTCSPSARPGCRA
ncbi:AAA family ATPase [uncultured Thiodictyon sp.]|uniref:AAA family ATPase n=1 Tax=uncultured Thiodictyon sp. TaxID=1846217 RepID=UPI00344763C5